jgi:integrase
MVLDADGRIAHRIELHDAAAKKRSGRAIPIHPDLRRALHRLRRRTETEGALIRSERGRARGMRSGSIVNWFGQLYRELGPNGCSSHSGRRTFITNAARLVFKAGGSLRDVQQLVGHRSIEQTQAYIDGQRPGEAAPDFVIVAHARRIKPLLCHGFPVRTHPRIARPNRTVAPVRRQSCRETATCPRSALYVQIEGPQSPLGRSAV